MRLRNWLVALDQFLFCTLTLGHSDPDWTLSAAAYRWHRDDKPYLRYLMPMIDWLFNDPTHCHQSYINEVTR